MGLEATKKENCNRVQEQYFNVEIQKKNYPSCYQYNVLIMLAKRLLNESNERNIYCQNKSRMEKRFLRKISNA